MKKNLHNLCERKINATCMRNLTSQKKINEGSFSSILFSISYVISYVM